LAPSPETAEITGTCGILTGDSFRIWFTDNTEQEYANTVDGDLMSGLFPSRTTCPECSEQMVVLQDLIFPSGIICECTAQTSITIGPGVSVKSGASLTLKAPQIKVRSGFSAEEGAAVKMIKP
jgi:hypothetical protein